MGYFDSLPDVGQTPQSSPSPASSGGGYFDTLPSITESAPLSTVPSLESLVPTKITPLDTSNLFSKTASFVNSFSAPRVSSTPTGAKDTQIKVVPNAGTGVGSQTTLSAAPKESSWDKIINPIKDALFSEDPRVSHIQSTIVDSNLLDIGKQLGIDKQIPTDTTVADGGVQQIKHDKAVVDYVRNNYDAIRASLEKPDTLPAHPDMLSPGFANVSKNIESYTKSLGLPYNPTTAEKVTNLLMLPVGAALLDNPVTIVGLAAFTALGAAEHAILGDSVAGKVAENFGLNNNSRDVLNLIEMFATGAALHSAYKAMPDITTKWTKDITTKYMPGKSIRFDPSKIHATLSGGVARGEITKEESELINSVLGKGGATAWKAAIKNGTIIDIAPEKVISIADKPYWAKVKGLLGVSTDPNVQRIPFGETKTGAESRASRLLGDGATQLKKGADMLDAETAQHITSHGESTTAQAMQDRLGMKVDKVAKVVARNKPVGAINPIRADGSFEGVNPKQATKLSREEAFPVGEKASQVYWDQKLAPELKAGRAVVVGTDDIKDHFGQDYNNNNHLVYSRAASVTLDRALKENKDPSVIFTGGGPASGKTELVVDGIKESNFKGTVMDSPFSSLENAKKQIAKAREAGKEIEIHGIIPDIGNSKVHSLMRGDEKGRQVPDGVFAQGHAGFPTTVKALLEEGLVKPEDVHLLDTRNITTEKEFRDFMKNREYAKDPLALLRSLDYNEYNEDNIKKKYATENYTKAEDGVQYIQKPELREKVGDASAQDRADEGKANGQGDKGGSSDTRREKELVEKEPLETKVRGLAQGVEEKAIENKLTKSLGDLPEYEPVSMKEQAEKAQKLLTEDYEKAKRIAMGMELPPEGLLPESVFVAVENKAIKDGDVNTLRDLATSSSLVSEATVMGQRIRTLAERNPESAVNGIRLVAKAREEAAKKRVANFGKAKKEVVKGIKSNIMKQIPSKQTWGEFIESIQC